MARPTESKGLSEKTKRQIIKKIASLIAEHLETEFQRLSLSPTLGIENKILEARPENRNLIKEISKIDWIRHTFSEDFIGSKVTPLLSIILEESNLSNFRENVTKRVGQMVTDLAAYGESYLVYVPLEGLELAKDLQELQFGDACLMQMTDQLLSVPRKHIERLQRELDTLQQRERDIIILAYEVDGLLNESKTEFKKLHSLVRKRETAQKSDEDLKSGDEEKDIDDVLAMRMVKPLDEIDKRFGVFLKKYNAKAYEDYEKRLSEEPDIARMKGSQSDAEFEKQIVEAMGEHIEEVDATYKQINREAKEREQTLDYARVELFKRQSDLNTLRNQLCVRYCYKVEPRKAVEYAEESAASLADLLRFALSVLHAKGKGPQVGLKGEIARGDRVMLAVSSAGNGYETVKSTGAKYPPLKIIKEHISILEDASIFDMAELLSQHDRPLTEIDDLFKRCISWFALSQTQKDKKSEFLSLAIILEVLLTPSDPNAPISATIADAAAILLANSETERREISQTMTAIYRKRSKIVHGKLKKQDQDFDHALRYLRNTVIKLIITVWELKARNKLKSNTKRDLTELVTSRKFQGPPVLT